MATRYGSHVTEDILTTKDLPPLDLAPQEHPMPKGDNELTDDYCEETDTHCPLAEILEQFCHLKDQFTKLKSTTAQSTSTAELMQFTNKLQHPSLTLQP